MRRNHWIKRLRRMWQVCQPADRPARPWRRPTARLGLELLEDRVTPTINTANLFNGLINDIKAAEASFAGAAGTIHSATASLPVIGKGLSQFQASAQSAIDSLDTKLARIASKDTDINQAITDLNTIIQSEQTAAQKASSNLNEITPQVQVVRLDPNSGTIELLINFTEQVTGSTFSFNAGLTNLPFNMSIMTAGAGKIGLDVAVSQIDIGLTNNTFKVFNNAGNQAHIELDVDGEVNSGASLSGKFGLFNISAKAAAFNPNTASGVGLVGSLVADLPGNGVTPSPRFQGLRAVVDLHLNGSLGAAPGANDGSYQVSGDETKTSLPNIGAELKFVWDLSGANPSGSLTSPPTVSLSNVQVGLGSFISSALAPVVNFIQEVTAPIEPLLDFLDAPIPGLSDIGAGKFSILTLAGLLNDTGVVPPGIQQVVSLAIDLTQLVTAIDQLQVNNYNGVTLDVGDFSLDPNQTSTDQLPDWNATTVRAVVGKLSDLIDSNIPADSPLRQPIDGVMQDIAALDSGIDVSFPFVENPLGSVIQMLLGGDADIVTLSADLDSPGGSHTLESLPIWGPIDLNITSTVAADLHFEIGYDTFGIREFALTDPSHKAADLLDGLYVDTKQPLVSISGGITASLGFPPTAIAGITGGPDVGLDGSFSLALNGGGTDGKVRPFDYPGGQLFDVEGDLTFHAGIDIDAYIGPFQTTLFSLPIVSKTIFSSAEIDPANPVNPPLPPGVDPSFGPMAQPATINIADFVDHGFHLPFAPHTVQVYSSNNSIFVDIDGTTLPSISAVDTSKVVLNAGNVSNVHFEVDGPLDVDVEGGGGKNSLTIDERGYHSTTFVNYHLSGTSLSAGTNEGGGIFATTNVNYSGIQRLQFITAADENFVYVDNLPTFPVEIDTAEQVPAPKRILGKLFSSTSLAAAFVNGFGDISSRSPINDIYINADALADGQTLVIGGHSGNDNLTFYDDSSSARNPITGLSEPITDIGPNQLTSAHAVHVPGSILTQLVVGTINYTGLSSLTVTGQDLANNQPVDRQYVLEAWNPSIGLTVQGAGGNDTFRVGDSAMDGVSGTSTKAPAITLDGGGGSNSVIFDDSTEGDTSYTADDGSTVPVTTSRPSWTVNGTQVQRTDVTTDDKTGAVTTVAATFAIPNEQGIQILGGESDSSYTVTSTALGTGLTLDTGPGADAVTVGKKSINLGGPLNVVGGGGPDTLTINDQNGIAAGVKSYAVSPTAVSTSGSVINYSGMSNIALTTTTLSSLVSVQGIAPGTAVALTTPGALNVSADFDHLAGPLSVTGNANRTTLQLASGNAGVAHTTVITPTTVMRDGAAPVTYASIKRLAVFGTSPANVFDVEGTAPGVSTTLTGGISHDTFNLAPSAHTLDVLQGPLTLQDTDSPATPDQGTVNINDDEAAPTHVYSFVTTALGNGAKGTTMNRTGAAAVTVAFADVDLNLYTDQSPDTVSVPKPLPPRTHLNILTGRLVPIDAIALGLAAIDIDGNQFDAAQPFSARLSPGTHTIDTIGSDAVSFTVNPDGTVSYDPSLEGTLTGAGTTSLKVNGQAVTFDATALAVPAAVVDYVGLDATAPFVARLLPGTHEFSTVGSDGLSFAVNPDGTVSYDPSLEGVLSGAGTSTLIVNGLAVSFDTTPLAFPDALVDYTDHDGTQPFVARILPGGHQLSTIGSDAVDFNVNLDGTVSYDPSLEGILTGAGTTTLTVNGLAVTFDATALGVPVVDVDYVNRDATQPFGAHYLPGMHVVYTTGSDENGFTINTDGTVGYDPSLQGVFSGAGTSTLTINGVSASIDASPLGVSTAYMDGAPVDASGPTAIRLLPGVHELYTDGADAVDFAVDPNGIVSYDASLEGVFSGAGTTTLTVNGLAVTFDARALGVSNIYVDDVAHDATQPFTFRYLPGQHSTFTTGNDVVGFTIDPDGTVSYDPSLEGALVGAGTKTLTVAGQAVTIDASALGVSEVDVDDVAHTATQPFIFRYLPGVHSMFTTGNDAVDFTVNPDATVSYDPSLAGVFSGAGTSDLNVNGLAVTFDATVLGVSNIYVDDGLHDATQPFTVRYLPGQHSMFTTGNDVDGFTINPDGTVAYDPSLEGAFTGAGTTTLTVAGRLVTFDPASLNVTTVYLDGIAYSADSRFGVRLLPGQHSIASAFDQDANVFTVNPDGTISYDPTLEGAFGGAGTTTLALVGLSVSVDARAIHTSTLTIDGTSYDPLSIANARLLPGEHVLETDSGVYNFTVNLDGTISYDASLDDVFGGAGTKTLRFL